MKNNDGKWMDTLAEQLNSSSDGEEEEEEDYSEEEEDMYGIEHSNDEQPSEGNYAEVDAPTKKRSKIDAKNVETGEQPRPTPTPQYPVDKTAFIQSLSFDTTEDAILAFFKSNKVAVEKCTLQKNNSGRSAGFAYIIFDNESTRMQAIKIYNGAMLDGRKLIISAYDPQLSYRRDGKRKKKQKADVDQKAASPHRRNDSKLV